MGTDSWTYHSTHRDIEIQWYTASATGVITYAAYTDQWVMSTSYEAIKDAIDAYLGVEGWKFIEHYQGISIYLWQTQDEYYGYWFAWEGEQNGPFNVIEAAREAIDEYLSSADGNGAAALGGIGLLILLYLIFMEMG